MADETAAALDEVRESAPSRWAARLIGGALLALAVGWIGALAWALAAVPAAALTPLRLAAWVGLGSGPLALLAILALLALRTGAVDANAFARRARLLRREADRLAALLALVDRRIEAAGADLASHGAELAVAGASAGERLESAGRLLRSELETVARAAAALDDATSVARTDLGVLLADLPDAEARTVTLAGTLRDLGGDAHGQVAQLAERLSALEAQAHAADVGSAAAAQRLATALERIEQATAAADRRIADVAARLEGVSHGALGEAATAFESIGGGIAEQSAALAAMLEQAKASFGRSGDAAARGLSRQLEALDQRLDAMHAGLIDQEKAARGLLGQLDQAIGALEARFATLGDTGTARTADLVEAIVAISEHTAQVGRALNEGGRDAEALLARAEALRGAVEASGAQLADGLPGALARVRADADRGLQLIAATAARADALVETAGRLGERLGDGEARIATQQAALDRLSAGGEQQLAALAAQLAGIETATERAGTELRGVAEDAASQLVVALGKVEAAAAEAGEQARHALAGAIPEAADALARTAAREVIDAVAGVGRTELAQVGVASAQAVEVARSASERLTGQLLAIAETTRQLEARIAEQRAASEAADEASFARQSGLLIEALNSTAIDVAKLFSNAPTDTAWAAYLKGDRGIFTRRAVRLLDGGEAKAIAQRYADDPEFHGQVDRYVADFEALLRRVLAVREGEAMGVTLLSSDMGKLYVALAQSIERLRR